MPQSLNPAGDLPIAGACRVCKTAVSTTAARGRTTARVPCPTDASHGDVYCRQKAGGQKPGGLPPPPKPAPAKPRRTPPRVAYKQPRRGPVDPDPEPPAPTVTDPPGPGPLPTEPGPLEPEPEPGPGPGPGGEPTPEPRTGGKRRKPPRAASAAGPRRAPYDFLGW